MNLDLALVHDLLIDEELGHGLSLVALQLDDVAELGVLDNGAVAAKLLLEHLQHLLKVDLLRDAGRGRERLAPVALLDADVNIVGFRRRGCGVGLEFVGGKRICAASSSALGGKKKKKSRFSFSTFSCRLGGNGQRDSPTVVVLSRFWAIQASSVAATKSDELKVDCLAEIFDGDDAGRPVL